MPAFTFKNSRGELVEMTEVPATQAKNKFGAMMKLVLRGGAIAIISRRGSPNAVMISYAEFEELVKAQSYALNNLDLAARV